MSSPHAARLARVIGVGGFAGAIVNQTVGSGIFGLPGLAAATLGPAAILGYLVCALLIGLVGLCFAEAGSRVARPGGIYRYATVAFGPVVGGVTGTLIWTTNTAVASAAVANLLVDTLAIPAPLFAGGAARAAVLAALYAVLTMVNIRGARWGAGASMALVVIKIAPLLLLLVVGAFAVRASNLEWTIAPTIQGVAQTSVLLFFAFMGLEGTMAASGEVVNPTRTIPLAILLALTVVGALYVSVQLVAQGVLGSDLAGSAAPLVATATVVFGPWGTQLLLAATLLSVLGYLSADVLCSPRNYLALAERGQLPRMLAVVHPRYKTPVAALVTHAVLCVLIAVSGSFRTLVIASTSGTLVLYLVCCLSVLRLRAHGVAMDGAPFRAPGGPFVPLAASAIILWLLASLAWRELAAVAVLVVASGIVYGVLERRRPGVSESPDAVRVG